MNPKLQEIKDLMIERDKLVKLEQDSDSKKESKDLMDKIDLLNEDIDTLVYDYLDENAPDSITIKIIVNKKINYDLSDLLDDVRYDITDSDPSTIDDLNINKLIRDKILKEFDSEYYIDDSDIKIEFDD